MRTSSAIKENSVRTAPKPLALESVRFIYEPYPIGHATSVFDAGFYSELTTQWPATHLFQFKPALGNKYSLSEVNHPDKYHAFLRTSAPWLKLYRYIKGREFVLSMLSMLRDHGVDLGLHDELIVTEHAFSSLPRLAWANLRRRVRGIAHHRGVLSTRFEFSMLPADGGCIKPHTDQPNKLVTLVLSMASVSEWNEDWGGGTSILRTRDPTRSFNFINRQMDFEDCDVLSSLPFLPNQCVVFVKTFNSHHAVYPMSGSPGAMRRTLTINIERVVA